MGAFLIAATPAGASTLAYVKDGAVWVSAADGSDAHQVETGLTFPALADDGTVYALAGNAQVAVLPPGVPEKPAIAIYGAGADELSVSPDGNELAWRDVQFGLHDLQHGVSVEQVSDGRRTDILGDEWPAWFTDTEVTMGGPNGGDLFDASTNEEHQAIWPDEYTTAYDTSINQYAIDRSGTRGAANMDITTGGGPPQTDPNAHTLVVFPVANAVPAVPTKQFCVLDGSQANPVEISDLTWSPDGSTLAWQEPDGIHEASVPTTSNCAQILGSHLVIPGGSEPAWGSSDDRQFPEPTAPPPHAHAHAEVDRLLDAASSRYRDVRGAWPHGAREVSRHRQAQRNRDRIEEVGPQGSPTHDDARDGHRAGHACRHGHRGAAREQARHQAPTHEPRHAAHDHAAHRVAAHLRPPHPAMRPAELHRRVVAGVLAGVVGVAVAVLVSTASAAGASTTLTQLEKALVGSATAAQAGHKGPSEANLRHIGNLARKLRDEIERPSAKCRKGLTAAEALAAEHGQTQRLRRGIGAARAGVRTCKVPGSTHKPGSGSGTGTHPTHSSSTASSTSTATSTTVVPQEGLGTVTEIKIVSTWKFNGVGSEDFCWDKDPSQSGATKYWKLEQDADLTFESDIHLDRNQAGPDTLELEPGSSYSSIPQPPCTIPVSYHLGAWTNGELHVALAISDADGTGAVALSVPTDVLNSDGVTVWSYGPGLPPPASDGVDWANQYTYAGFTTGMSEEIDWPSGIDGGSPSTTYTSLGVGGHVVAQLHENKSLDDAPSLTGTADILIQLLSS